MKEKLIMKKNFNTSALFPTILYVAHSSPPQILEDIKSIKVMSKSESSLVRTGNISEAADIFNTNKFLAPLKEFCELHIKQYVEELIKPKEELDFYITQSWLSITPPGGNHGPHSHPNSIISGIFCVQACENDNLFFIDPFFKFKTPIEIEPQAETAPSPTLTGSCSYPVTENILFLFPSWLFHEVKPNPHQTIDRISIAFNVHAKGIFGRTDRQNRLIIQ